MFRLDKKKIFLLYQYYLLGSAHFSDTSLLALEEGIKNRERIVWFNNCLKREKFLRERISKKLKAG
jgi:hypothetical protein